jgi:hypothetical protein
MVYVSQGSGLGPILFLLFINYLPQALQEANVVLFADDTNIILTDSELISLNEKTNEQTPWPLVRERTISTERLPLVDEI